MNWFKPHRTSVAEGGWRVGMLLSRLAAPYPLDHTAPDDLTRGRGGATKPKKPSSLESLKHLPADGVWCGRLGFPHFSLLLVVALLVFPPELLGSDTLQVSAHVTSSCRWVIVIRTPGLQRGQHKICYPCVSPLQALLLFFSLRLLTWRFNASHQANS